MSKLHFRRTGVAPGRGRRLVIFLHGYGADGADLIGLGDALAPALADTVFLAPDAPDRVAGNPFGRQWFPIPAFDGSDPHKVAAAFAAAAETIADFIDAASSEEGIAPAATALFGFSQGAMMALHVAPRRADPLGAVVASSGQLLAPERLVPEMHTRPPVLLLHGDQDPVVPFESMGKARDALTAAGIAATTHVMRGTGHGIAPDGLTVALQFLRRHLIDGTNGA